MDKMIKVGEIDIDTTLDYAAHRVVINKKNSCLCSSDSPKQFFTEPGNVPKEDKDKIKSTERFYNLHYNADGSKLLKIEYWDHQYIYYDKEVPVNDQRECYFDKHKPVGETKTVRDYKANYTSHIVIWDRNKDLQSGRGALPSTSGTISETYKGPREPRKKRFGIF